MNNVLFIRMLCIFEELYKSYSNFGKAGRLGLLYDKTITFYQRGRRRKKERVWKRMRLSHVFFTPARDSRHMPRLHAKMASIVRKPFTSFAKIPTRDPEILPCYWSVAAKHTQSSVHTQLHKRTHTPGKIILFPVHILSNNFTCTSFLLPKCSISIREGNGKFACTCTKARIINYRNKYVVWMIFGKHLLPMYFHSPF